jgi:hypothetical protein
MRFNSSMVRSLSLSLFLGACSSIASSDARDAAAGAGGAGGAGGVVILLGIGGAGGTDECAGAGKACYRSCGDDTLIGPICSGGALICPDGSVEPANCPASSCVRQYDLHCCDVTTGRRSLPMCKVDGTRDVCPTGTRALVRGINYACIPDGVVTTDCSDLGGIACSLDQQECYSGFFFCQCGLGSDGRLAWICGPVSPIP